MGDGGVFHTPCTDFSRSVEEFEYTCFLKSTFTEASHVRGFKTCQTPVTYPECVFCGKKYRWGVANVECHCWSIEGWIHSKRRNRLHQKLVEKLVLRTHTNLVLRTLNLRESLDDTLHHLLPWDIELIIDEPVDEPEEEPEV